MIVIRSGSLAGGVVAALRRFRWAAYGGYLSTSKTLLPIEIEEFKGLRPFRERFDRAERTTAERESANWHLSRLNRA